MWKPTEQENALLKQCASSDINVAYAARQTVAKAVELPLRKGIQPGDIQSDIFEEIPADGLSTMEFPLDFLPPGTESEMAGFTMPSFGAIPQKHVQGDFINVPIYYTANAIDLDMRYIRNARWDVVTRAADVMQKGMVKKKNDDAWHTLLSAAFNRNIIVADSDVAAGIFSVRLASLGKLVLGRNGGGNSSSVNNFSLTDLFISLEAEADMRSWNVDQIDEITRREIFTTPDGTLNRIFSVNIHALHELGEGQEYNTYFVTTLGATLPTAGNVKLEAAFGMDLSKSGSFVSPVGEPLTVYADDSQRRSLQQGWYCTEARGWAVLDTRNIISLAI